ncbi:ParM/StbA family protein [Aliifodinibius sp. S!AR15-10]|uniref:ParM/StbA family protein n=1 Tax=Aliifodinibius sp. S!AR15-10 TaxID=2950437 RepID=UPI0028648F8E|nr:ParM/StbA family protein [Aliifodinibius sp. S!AR15-10]MDR8393563.1 ParM/StbA family protein [Aliifodinibius sp. S!AR15-10]
MMEISVFPSVFESTRAQLNNVSNTLLEGLKIEHNDESYIIGELALKEGLSPHRLINCAPGELDFEILFRAALLMAQQNAGRNFSLTLGFPFALYQVHQNTAKQQLTKTHDIIFDSSTYSLNGTSGKQAISVSLNKVFTVPEVAGSIIALRYGENPETEDFIVLSLGYGSCEGVVSTKSGIIRRTAISTRGIRYAVNLMKDELQKEHFLGFKTEHQLNVAFQKGNININKRSVDLANIKQKVLRSYYSNIIRPALLNAFQDSDFDTCKKLYLVGGGAYFSELTNQIKSEFEDVLTVIIPDNPHTLAVRGYCINTQKQTEDDVSVGIDLGNANTLVCVNKQSPHKE